MNKTNKELAVELYSAYLIAEATAASNPNFQGTHKIPTYDESIETIKNLTKKLSIIKDP